MFNQVLMLGNLTRDIELRYLPSDTAVAKSAIATTYKYKSASGEQKEDVCFLDFTIFGKMAEIANQYLKKGSKVLLTGRLILEQWTTQSGESRSRHILRVDEMKMLDSKDKSDNQGQQSSRNEQSDYRGNGYNGNVQKQEHRVECEMPEINIEEDEIPF